MEGHEPETGDGLEPTVAEIQAVRRAAAQITRGITGWSAVIREVGDQVEQEFRKSLRQGIPWQQAAELAQSHVPELARALLARRGPGRVRLGTGCVCAADFEAYLRGDGDAFARILEQFLRPNMFHVLRRSHPQVQGAIHDDWASEALMRLWRWWRRRPADLPPTPMALLSYGSRTLERVIKDEGRKQARRGLVTGGGDMGESGDAVAAPGGAFADMGEFVLATLGAWEQRLPVNAPAALLAILPAVAALARRLGRFPCVADLIGQLGLTERTAQRRQQEFARLLRLAIEDHFAE